MLYIIFQIRRCYLISHQCCLQWPHSITITTNVHLSASVIHDFMMILNGNKSQHATDGDSFILLYYVKKEHILLDS